MNYDLLLKVLNRHIDQTQKAVNFFREHQKGVEFAVAMEGLNEAIRARDHVELEKRKHSKKH